MSTSSVHGHIHIQHIYSTLQNRCLHSIAPITTFDGKADLTISLMVKPVSDFVNDDWRPVAHGSDVESPVVDQSVGTGIGTDV